MSDLDREILKTNRQRERSKSLVIMVCRQYLKEMQPDGYLTPAPNI